jgi:hypothetical protein
MTTNSVLPIYSKGDPSIRYYSRTNQQECRDGEDTSMDRRPVTENTLFYGDNLKILREYIASECIDLIYLDPPFNSSRNYNVLFKDESGIDSEAQIVAFGLIHTLTLLPNSLLLLFLASDQA